MKSEKVAKKKGGSHKKKRLQEEELNNNSFDGTGDYANASSPPGHESASLDDHMVWRPRTRYALSLGYKKAALSFQSRIPVRNVDGNSSETPSLSLVKRIGSNSLDKANHVSLEAKDSHSQLESRSPDKVVEGQNGMTCYSKIENQRENMLDLGKFTLDLPAQTQQPGLPFQGAAQCSGEIMLNNLPGREANVVFNISANGTVRTSEIPTTSPTCSIPTTRLLDDTSPQNHEFMSNAEDPMIDVEGYKVKKEAAPLLKAIFSKYGDIARESTFSMESRSCLLELVCSIYKRLEASKFFQLTPLELESMLGQIGDLKLVQVDVEWLHKRLYYIFKARQMYEGVSTLEDFKARTVINEKQKAVQGIEEELQACMAAAMKLQERLQQEKDELAAVETVATDIYDGSLVRGLV